MFNDDVDAMVFSRVIFMNNIWHGLIYNIGLVKQTKKKQSIINKTQHMFELFRYKDRICIWMMVEQVMH